jgi:hypothetical protein
MRRGIRSAVVLGIAIAGATLTAQSTGARKTWTPLLTADGQPDLQGIWTNATITPFERPASLRDKAFLTEAEVAAIERQVATNRAADPKRPGDVGSYDQVWFDSGDRIVSTRRTSLVIDPPDGRVPLRPEAEAARDYNSAHERDSYEFMSVWDRCITRGAPAGMFPAGYNNAYQIIQTPGYVVIHSEMIHEARIIPVDGRPHAPAQVRQWNGDPRGRWDAKTLVVDTTNYNDRGSIATSAATGRIRGIPQSEALHITERFTRVDADTLNYEFTIEDPMTWTRPWSARIPWTKIDPDEQMYEYACHEDNFDIVHFLTGARAREKRGETVGPRPAGGAAAAGER